MQKGRSGSCVRSRTITVINGRAVPQLHTWCREQRVSNCLNSKKRDLAAGTDCPDCFALLRVIVLMLLLLLLHWRFAVGVVVPAATRNKNQLTGTDAKRKDKE